MVLRRWGLPLLVFVVFTVSGLVNAHSLMYRKPPAEVGVVLSAGYVLLWVAHAFDAGRLRSSGSLRRMAVIWAVVIGAIAIVGDYLQFGLGDGSSEPGGWIIPAILLVVSAPLYGLVPLFPGDPLLGLIGVAVGSAGLTMVSSLVGRRMSPVSAGGRRRPSIPERATAEDDSVVRGLSRG